MPERPELRTVRARVKVGQEYLAVEMDLTEEEYEKTLRGEPFTPPKERVRYCPTEVKH